VEKIVGPAGQASTGSPPFTSQAKKVLQLSLREQVELGDYDVGTEHLLLGLIREGEGVAVEVLVALGADLPRVRRQVMDLRANAGARPEQAGWITTLGGASS
jgi:ATP-dependent Clp protease ATP-binding subunit ClpC